MDLEDVIFSKISQAEKDKYYMLSLNMWNLENKTNKQSTIKTVS